LYVTNYVVDQQLLNMRYFFASAYQKLRVKAQMDPNLTGNQTFQANFAAFAELHRAVEDRSKAIEARIREERFLQAEETQRLRKQIQGLENNPIDSKKLRRIISLVCNSFQIRFHKQHLQSLQTRIRDEFKTYFAIESEQEINVNAYGLTGAGVHFLNSTLKVQLRLHQAVDKFARFVDDVKGRLDAGTQDSDFRLTPTSWFSVRHVREQHVYLQLEHNDYSEEYNGVVFKVKFQHMNARREFLLAKLLNLYTFLDRNKFLPLAYFWLFFLKINGFVGQKRGFLSSTTYLMMLINYLQ
jgi:cation transport regulator ChaC